MEIKFLLSRRAESKDEERNRHTREEVVVFSVDKETTRIKQVSHMNISFRMMRMACIPALQLVLSVLVNTF